jgi:peptidoglycan-associated lipoprotein
MKLRTLFNLTVLGTALTMTAVGCKTAPKGVTPIKGQKPSPHDEQLGNGNQIQNNNNPPFDATRGGGIPPANPGDYAGWPENREQFSADKVYFEFDKSAIKSSEHSKLDDVASFMKSNPADAIRVEGNCDKRGTEEYNRALGERRAFAAREYLVNSGIDASKILTLSNGEDKPAETGSDEASYSKNRRDEFILLTPPNPR